MREITVIRAERQAKELLHRLAMLSDEDIKTSEMGFGNKRTASVKRASMDLSRTLADVRVNR